MKKRLQNLLFYFQFRILKLLNQRKLETFKERWWNQNPKKVVCEDEGDDTSGGISIYNIGGVFIVIFVGIALAIFTLVIEYWYYKYKKPASRISTGSDLVAKQLKVKQQIANSAFDNGGNKTEYGLTFRNTAGAAAGNGDNVIPPVDKNW